MSDAPLRALGIAGSLRKGSFNRALLRAAHELKPEGLEIDDFEIGAIPLYDGDVEDKGDPEPVAAFKKAVQSADAILIATPEYNYGVPGVLKNAIDWVSRPIPGTKTRVLNQKPAAILGASQGSMGTVRAQSALRQTFQFTQTLVMLQPEVLVALAQTKFDAEGRLTDEPTREVLKKFLAAFLAWSRRMKG